MIAVIVVVCGYFLSAADRHAIRMKFINDGDDIDVCRANRRHLRFCPATSTTSSVFEVVVVTSAKEEEREKGGNEAVVQVDRLQGGHPGQNR